MQRTHLTTCLLSMLAAFTAAGIGHAGEAPDVDVADAVAHKCHIDGWAYGRARKTIHSSNKVDAQFKIKNTTKVDLNDVAVTVTLLSAMGEVACPPMLGRVGVLKAGETKPVQVSALLVPIFESYRMDVTYRGGKEAWVGSSDVAQPQPFTDDLIPGTSAPVVLGQDMTRTPQGQLKGHVRVKNQGALEATNLKVKIVFYGTPPRQPKRPAKKPISKKADPKKKDENKVVEKAHDVMDGTSVRGPKLGEWSGPLGDGKLAGGVTKAYPVAVPIKLPRNFASHTLSITCDQVSAEKAISGGEFQNIKELEAAHFVFTRAGDKSQNLDVTCKLRNGLAKSLDQAMLILTFFDADKKAVKEFKQPQRKPIESGAVVDMAFTIPDVPKFASFEQALEYQAQGTKPTAKAPALPKNFQKLPTVEVLMKDFMTQDDGTVLVVCAARNGRPHFVKDVVITALFLKDDGSELTATEKKLPNPMGPGEVRNFVVRGKNAKAYASVTTKVGFVEMRPTPKAVPPAAPVEAPADEAPTAGKTAEAPAVQDSVQDK